MSLLLQGPRRQQRASRDTGKPIVVGIVNNMPDPALQSTERQFCELLSCAAGGRSVCAKFFSLPGLPRGQLGQLHISQHHAEIEQLWQGRFDGLIVTGTEPLAGALRDEPYWSDLRNLVDWAEQNTVSTIWSCLAAHAAVDHLDGIERYAQEKKLFGVFECVRLADHLIIDGFAPRWPVPHSRYNGLCEETLASCGYQVLARSDGAGVDMFVKKRNSLFLFLQGHLEYDAAALLREYRRDIGRYLAFYSDNYPEIPCGYFSDDTTHTLLEFRERALRERDINALVSFPIAEAKQKLTGPWRDSAAQLYTNWLSYLVEHRSDNHLEEVTSDLFAHPYSALTAVPG
jgi:homoserine O-succinyltransferase/O-acetyltransferase